MQHEDHTMKELHYMYLLIEREQSGCEGLLGRHSIQSLPLLWHWNWWQEPTEDTEWATYQGKISICNVTDYIFDYIILMSVRLPSLSSYPQTAQDISFANVQALFQSMSSRRGCPSTSQSDAEGEETSTQIDQKSVTISGKRLLTTAGL